MSLADRPLVPEEWVLRLDAVLVRLTGCRMESAWTGTRWRVGTATVAHVFGGEDQRFRITFRGEPDEVHAFEHLGEPYFRSDWGGNVIGLLLDEGSDWEELAELLTESYCLQAPAHFAEQVARPGRIPTDPKQRA
ncbi:MAG: MmcQ/YjbR family DNA-binding protein [Mycobacteriales bacterium]